MNDIRSRGAGVRQALSTRVGLPKGDQAASAIGRLTPTAVANEGSNLEDR
jgi:hypothetical protein